MIIDCGTCAHSPSRTGDRLACDDCVVSVLLGPIDLPGPIDAVEIAEEHAAAVSVLAESGLVPPLRLVRPPRAS